MFLKIDGTLVVQIVNFFIFYAILTMVYIKPAAEALRKRRAYLDSVQAEYEASLREARDLKAQAEDVRAAARREGEQRASLVRTEADRQAEEIAVAAQERVTFNMETAHKVVQSELNEQTRRERAIVDQLADLMLARTLGTEA